MDPTWAAVRSRRLDRHFLTGPATAAADVAAAVCGAHAQVLTAAELSIGLRLAGAARGDVRRALWEDPQLVKTFGPRGTVHLLPTADLPMWTGALSALPQPRPASRRRAADAGRRPTRSWPRSATALRRRGADRRRADRGARATRPGRGRSSR